jgi:myosin-15
MYVKPKKLFHINIEGYLKISKFNPELQRDGAIYYLIFCRSVWHYPLRLDNPLYIEVVFNQIAPDYLEGLLLVMPGEQIDQEVVYDIAKVIRF